jgi:hypothetical protein
VSQLINLWIAQSVLRRATSWTTGVRFPARLRDFSLLHSVQTGSGVHLASYAMGTWNLFAGVKRPGREADHSHPVRVEFKHGRVMFPFLNTSSYRGA